MAFKITGQVRLPQGQFKTGESFSFPTSGWEFPTTQLITGSNNLAASTYISNDGTWAFFGERGDYSTPAALRYYTRTGDTWSQNTIVDTKARAYVGDIAVNQAETRFFASAPQTGSLSTRYGEAYYYSKSDATFSQRSFTRPSTTNSNQYHGSRIVMDAAGDHALISNLVTSSNRGTVGYYTRSSNSWSLTGSTLVNPIESPSTNFGLDMTMNDTATYAAIGYNSGSNPNTNRVECYSRSGTTWTRTQTIIDGTDNSFGRQIVMDGLGDKMVVSYTGANSNTGQVHYYTRSGSSWSEQQVIVPDDAAPGDNFGASVDINKAGDQLFVSGPLDQGGNGLIYVYVLVNNQWEFSTTIVTPFTGRPSVKVNRNTNTLLAGSGNNVFIVMKSGV